MPEQKSPQSKLIKVISAPKQIKINIWLNEKKTKDYQSIYLTATATKSYYNKEQKQWENTSVFSGKDLLILSKAARIAAEQMDLNILKNDKHTNNIDYLIEGS